MTLYIDPPLWPAHGTLFSHLISDVSLEELHSFASHAELSPHAFDRDHYDVPAHRHGALVGLGAVPVTGRELARILAGCGLRVRGVERAEKVRGRLELAWARLGARLGCGSTGWQALGEELLDRWSEPHRHYHSVTHLASVLSAAAALHRAGEPTGEAWGISPEGPSTDTAAAGGDAGPAAPVLLAAWFHDAVYAGRAGADEGASAALAEERLEPLLPEPAVAETARLVRLTATHSPDQHDCAGAVLIDADLEVLARPPAAYRRYVQQVRADYSHVPEHEFAVGRAAVLERLLDRERLYRTPTGHRRWEASARRNLEEEAQSLRSGRAGEDFGFG